MKQSTREASSRYKASSQRSELPVQQAVEASFRPRRVIQFLSICASLLVLAGVTTGIAVLRLPDFTGRDVLAPLMDLRAESSVPATFSALILLVAGLLFWVISVGKYATRDRFATTWGGLSLLFFYLALDENTQIHERASAITQRTFQTDGLLFYAWVIPYAILALIIGLALLRFLAHLPARIRLPLLLSGAMYLGGALGFELLEGQTASADAIDQMRLVWLTSIEEALEMFAVIILIWTLLEYIRTQMPGLFVRLRIIHEQS